MLARLRKWFSGWNHEPQHSLGALPVDVPYTRQTIARVSSDGVPPWDYPTSTDLVPLIVRDPLPEWVRTLLRARTVDDTIRDLFGPLEMRARRV